eukprot:comp23785_c1_seq1/m.41275 comp23785_c1_seq1/g.41275  ORF comp23785_c1_seq1/g.41275 comp23785_c1_seq1/m.41275 type:complete len:825 (-) comp23785_c1_seq1:161-2635(-)
MSTFKKAKPRSIRKKDEDEEEEDVNERPKLSLKDLADKKKAKKVAVKGPSLLSFGDEEGEEEEFKVKKSKESRRLAKESKEKKAGLVVPRHEEEEGVRKNERSGEYTAERLAALKTNALARPGGTPLVERNESFQPQRSVTIIPDAKLIHEARKRREMARAQGLGGDYIPISSNGGSRAGSQAGDERDGSEDENFPDDERNRVQFGDTRVIQNRQRQAEVQAAYDHQQERDSSDDEVSRWEAEQIRKGGGRGGPDQATDPMAQISTQAYLQQHYMTPGQSKQPLIQMLNQRAHVPFIPPIKPDVPNSAEEVMAKLQNTLIALKRTHTETSEHLKQLQESLGSTEGRVSGLEGEYSVARQTYQYFQDMRFFTTALIGCLDEKAPEVERIETSMHTVLRERAEALVRHRQGVTEDYLEQLEELVPGIKVTKGRPGQESDIDEFGRDRSTYKKTERKERLRARGLKRKLKMQMAGGKLPPEGLSSEDEKDAGDPSEYNAKIEAIQQQAREVFEDTSDQFSSVHNVRLKLEGWKGAYPQAYADAYVNTCVPRIFVPYVRLQMVDWQPLLGLGTDFEHQEWFTELLTYGQPCPDDDPDCNLVLDLMQRVLMPKLTGLARHCFDPLSARQTRRLKDMLGRLEDYPIMEQTNKAAQSLMGAITDRLAQSLQEDIVVPLIPKDKREDPACGAIVHRLIWQAIKFVENACQLCAWLPIVRLQDIVIEGVLNPHLLPVLAAQGPSKTTLNMVERLHGCLPPAWLSDISQMGQLSILHRYRLYLLSLATGLGPKLTPGTPETMSIMGRVTSLLDQVCEGDRADELRKQHGLAQSA